jgi:hypothetical protein
MARSQHIKPTSWAEFLDPANLDEDDLNSDLDKMIAANITDSLSDVANRIEQNTKFATITMASGQAGVPILLHNITGLGASVNPQDDEYIALAGMGRMANIFSLDFKKAFGKRHNIRVPYAAFIIQEMNPDNVEGFEVPVDVDDVDRFTQSISIIMGIQIPAWLTKLINVENWTSAEEILAEVVRRSIKEVDEAARDLGEDGEEFLQNIDEENVPYRNLICHLYKWYSNDKNIKACITPNLTKEAGDMLTELHDELARVPRNKRNLSFGNDVERC